MSHPLWVRGLKPKEKIRTDYSDGSHPLWVRGLKQFEEMNVKTILLGRTLCGCVD